MTPLTATNKPPRQRRLIPLSLRMFVGILTRLQVLSLLNTHVTDAGVVDLKQILRNVTIEK